MFKTLLFFSVLVMGIFAQTVDVQFYEEEACNDNQVGASCTNLHQNTCCVAADLWTSVSTDGWVNVNGNTLVNAYSQQNGLNCGVIIATLEQGECVISETPDVFSGQAFTNGDSRKRRSLLRRAADSACTSTQEVNQYFYQEDGVKYIIDATNATHAAAFANAKNSAARAQYIKENFETTSAATKITKTTKISA